METNKQMTNQEIAQLLRSMAAAYEVKDEDFFRTRAYENAAASIEHATSDLKDLWEEGKLEELSGVGSSIQSHLDELFRTGKVKHFEKEMEDMPEGMFELIKINGVGPKTAYRLAEEFGLDKKEEAMEGLRKAAEEGKIAELEGFGEDSQKKILKAIKKQVKRKDRLLLPEAQNLAEEVVRHLEKHDKVKKVEVLGSLRRKVATIGDVDIAVATKKPKEVMEYLLEFEGIKKVLSSGPKTTMFVHKNGRQVDVKTQDLEKWGSMLQHYTGSKHHNIHLRTVAKEKGMSLSEHGIKSDGKLSTYRSEEEFYKALGMQYIPPELREDQGEIEAAQGNDLPKLIQLKEIKGDLQVHSNYDLESSHDIGKNSVEELLKKAEELGYQYLGVTDHNPKQSGLDEKERREILKARNEAFEKEYSSYEKQVKKGAVKLLKGLEVDIKPDGELALEDKTLELLDYVVVSIHSSLRQDKEQATKRVLRGLRHPKARILGHPTGRLLGKREGLDYDWERLFEFCVKNDKWVEVNASPQRLDLSDGLIRQAIKAGVKLVINTDAHEADSLEFMRYGVWTARRGWAQKENIVNTLPWKEISEKLKI